MKKLIFFVVAIAVQQASAQQSVNRANTSEFVCSATCLVNDASGTVPDIKVKTSVVGTGTTLSEALRGLHQHCRAVKDAFLAKRDSRYPTIGVSQEIVTSVGNTLDATVMRGANGSTVTEFNINNACNILKDLK